MKHSMLSAAVMSVLIMSLFSMGAVWAKKKPKSGEVDGRVFSDSKFDFSITLPEGWKISLKPKKSSLRFVSLKKDYAIPMHFRVAPNHTEIPKIKIYVDTTSLDVRDFVDSLASKTFDSRQKRDIVSEFELLDGQYKRPRIRRLRLENGLKGRRLSTKLKYTINVQAPGELTSTVVTDFLSGQIVFLKKDDHLVMIYLVCESLFYKTNAELFEKALETLSFGEKPEKEES
ncbi:MAG: hypothetical protein IIB00_07565 [candidate division Zixibacteria bacterium]|nr:hypothetical protein [candidate division Zixibacteria bacterium]